MAYCMGEKCISVKEKQTMLPWRLPWNRHVCNVSHRRCVCRGSQLQGAAFTGHRNRTIRKSGVGGKVLKILLGVIVVVLIGGAVFLATWDIPAPNQQVEKVIPDDRFPR